MKKGMVEINGRSEVAEIVRENPLTAIFKLPNCRGNKNIKKRKGQIKLMFGDRWD